MISCPECEGLKVATDHETNNKYCEDCACLIAGTNSFTENNFQTYEQKLLTSLYTSQKYKKYSSRNSFTQTNAGIDKYNLQSIRKKTKTFANELSLSNCFTEQILSLYRSYKDEILKQSPTSRIDQKKFIQAAFVLITKNNNQPDQSIGSFTNICKGLGIDCKTTRKYYFDLDLFVRSRRKQTFPDLRTSLMLFINKSASSFEINNKEAEINLFVKCSVIYNILSYYITSEIQFLCVYLMGLVWTFYEKGKENSRFILKKTEVQITTSLADTFKVDIDYMKNNLIYLKKNIRDKIGETFPYAEFLTNRTLYVELDYLYINDKIKIYEEKSEKTHEEPLYIADHKEIEEEAVKYIIC